MEARLEETERNTGNLFRSLFMIQTLFNQYNQGDLSYSSELNEISVLIDELISKMVEDYEKLQFD
ncbi:MAG: hypothetical protein AB8B56_05735 [Crocinitomicaceae bacterium]